MTRHQDHEWTGRAWVAQVQIIMKIRIPSNLPFTSSSTDWYHFARLFKAGSLGNTNKMHRRGSGAATLAFSRSADGDRERNRVIESWHCCFYWVDRAFWRGRRGAWARTVAERWHGRWNLSAQGHQPWQKRVQ